MECRKSKHTFLLMMFAQSVDSASLPAFSSKGVRNLIDVGCNSLLWKTVSVLSVHEAVYDVVENACVIRI